jgi:hypothetical protein
VWWLGFVRWRRAIKLSLKKRERKKEREKMTNEVKIRIK